MCPRKGLYSYSPSFWSVLPNFFPETSSSSLSDKARPHFETLTVCIRRGRGCDSGAAHFRPSDRPKPCCVIEPSCCKAPSCLHGSYGARAAFPEYRSSGSSPPSWVTKACPRQLEVSRDEFLEHGVHDSVRITCPHLSSCAILFRWSMPSLPVISLKGGSVPCLAYHDPPPYSCAPPSDT